MSHTIFIIDDDETQLMLAEQAVRGKLGYRTITARGGREAVERFLLRARPQPSLLLLDLMMPEVGGMDVIKSVRRVDKHIPIIVMSAYGGMAQAVAAVEAGASDFLMKPVSLERLRLSIQNQLQRVRLSEELLRMSRLKSNRAQFSDMIGQDERLHAAITMARRAADSSIPILLQGEKGVGKELLARAIHGSGNRCDAPFAMFDSRSGSEAELARLLGQDGASSLAGGTIYIKRLEHLSQRGQAMVQVALSRSGAWEEQSFCGRVIVGCNEPLADLMQRGDLTEALYDKLRAYPIALPALRERKADIVALAEHFMERFAAQDDRPIQDLTMEARQLLMAYDWPGNVGELMRQMQRAVIGCDGRQMTPFHFGTLLEKAGADLAQYVDWMQAEGGMKPAAISLTNEDGNIKPMHELEAEMIQYAIRHYGGRMSEVARRLGIGRSTLYRKIQDYNIEDAA